MQCIYYVHNSTEAALLLLFQNSCKYVMDIHYMQYIYTTYTYMYAIYAIYIYYIYIHVCIFIYCIYVNIYIACIVYVIYIVHLLIYAIYILYLYVTLPKRRRCSFSAFRADLSVERRASKIESPCFCATLPVVFFFVSSLCQTRPKICQKNPMKEAYFFRLFFQMTLPVMLVGT